jgi:hypothetical protein
LTRGRGRPVSPRRLHNPNVFINVPFDSHYEKCYLALIAGLCGAGLKPCSVLELASDRDRLQLLFRRLAQCSSSLHAAQEIAKDLGVR